jgi:hypothetical protein
VGKRKNATVMLKFFSFSSPFVTTIDHEIEGPELDSNHRSG